MYKDLRILYNEKLPLIFEAFVAVYGQDSKEIIREKLQFSEIIFYNKDEHQEYIPNISKFLFDREFIENNMRLNAFGVIPNITKHNKLFNTILINDSIDGENIYNVVILHELNHVIGSNYNGVINNVFNVDYGISERNFDGDYNFPDNEGIEYLDEVMNHYITLQAVALFNESKFPLFDNPEKAITHDTSLYEEVFSLLMPFLKRYDKQIKELYLKGNKQKFIDEIGLVNFYELKDILKYHYRKEKKDDIIEEVTQQRVNNIYESLGIETTKQR